MLLYKVLYTVLYYAIPATLSIQFRWKKRYHNILNKEKDWERDRLAARSKYIQNTKIQFHEARSLTFTLLYYPPPRPDPRLDDSVLKLSSPDQYNIILLNNHPQFTEFILSLKKIWQNKHLSRIN